MNNTLSRNNIIQQHLDEIANELHHGAMDILTILKNRCSRPETSIANDPYSAKLYASLLDVLKIFERRISRDPVSAELYHLIKNELANLEKTYN